MSKPLVAALVSIAVVASYLGYQRHVSNTETLTFPSGYLSREKPSIFFDDHRDTFTNEFLYDLVIEEAVEFIVIKNWIRISGSDRPAVGGEYLKLTRSENQTVCAKITPLSRAVKLTRVFRSNFDVLRGKCVLVRPVDQIDTDLELKEHGGFWSFEIRSSGKQVARAPKAYRRQEMRALFGDRVYVAQKANSPIYKDDFTERELVAAIERGGYARIAALSIVALRARIKDNTLIPEISVRKTVSRKVVEALLNLFPPKSESGWGIAPGFSALIPGASAETAALIYPKLVDMLYAPLKATKPHGPWYYGNQWKLQIRENRPALEPKYIQNQFVPAFAVTGSFRSASALVLRLGQPYIKRFYEEFKTEIINRTMQNSGPSFYTTILAQSESDLDNVVSRIRHREMSPVLYGTLWALIEQGRNFPNDFFKDLNSGCKQDPNFLNNPRASKKYLDGKSFCSHYFNIESASPAP